MSSKWIVYFLTLISYALIHSIRSAWSSLKQILDDPPFDMSTQFLGVLDMTVLFSLAITLTVFGNQIQRYGPKKYLIGGMALLIALSILIAIFLMLQVTSKIIYLLFYGLGVGIISASGWPSCLSILSKRFNKTNNVALPLWNGTSQLGDFIALLISELIIQGIQGNGAITLIIIPILMIIALILNKIFLPTDSSVEEASIHISHQLNEQKQIPQKKQNGQQKQQKPNKPSLPSLQIQIQQQENKRPIQIDELSVPPLRISQRKDKRSNQANVQSDSQRQSLPPIIVDQESEPINFMNVWLLPSVAGYVIANSLVKSVNAIVIAWLVFYLYKLDMKPEARIIAILWSVFVFLGGALGGYINPKYSKKIFIISLMISAVMFIFLEQLHLHPNYLQVILTVILCALSYGGPYNMMSTAVPLMLSEKPEIRDRKGAKAAIIALMQGFAMLICGFALLIVPSFGVLNMHWMAFFLCLSAGIILSIQQLRESKK